MLPKRPMQKSRPLSWWFVLVLFAIFVSIFGFSLAIAFIANWQAVGDAHRYCRKKGGLVVNEVMPNAIIMAEFKTNGAPGLSQFGDVIANEQQTLAQLDAIDEYQLQQVKRKPRGRALAALLESPRRSVLSVDVQSETAAAMVPWDDQGPMIIASPKSQFCRDAIKIDMEQAIKILGKNRINPNVRFCRPNEQDYQRLYIRNSYIFNHLRYSLFGNYIYFEGWRVYRWGETEPAVTMTKIGVEPVSSKLIMPIALRGVDPEFAGNICTVPELAKTTKGAANPSSWPDSHNPFAVGRTIISGNSGYAYPGKRKDD